MTSSAQPLNSGDRDGAIRGPIKDDDDDDGENA